MGGYIDRERKKGGGPARQILPGKYFLGIFCSADFALGRFCLGKLYPGQNVLGKFYLGSFCLGGLPRGLFHVEQFISETIS